MSLKLRNAKKTSVKRHNNNYSIQVIIILFGLKVCS